MKTKQKRLKDENKNLKEEVKTLKDMKLLKGINESLEEIKKGHFITL